MNQSTMLSAGKLNDEQIKFYQKNGYFVTDLGENISLLIEEAKKDIPTIKIAIEKIKQYSE